MLALLTGLAGCSSIDSFLSGDKVDYRNSAAKTKPLEVPPDLTQLARDPRYSPQGGVISASPRRKPEPAARQRLVGGRRPVGRGQGAASSARGPSAGWSPRHRLKRCIPRCEVLARARLRPDHRQPPGGRDGDRLGQNRAKLPNDLIRSTLGRLC